MDEATPRSIGVLGSPGASCTNWKKLFEATGKNKGSSDVLNEFDLQDGRFMVPPSSSSVSIDLHPFMDLMATWAKSYNHSTTPSLITPFATNFSVKLGVFLVTSRSILLVIFFHTIANEILNQKKADHSQKQEYQRHWWIIQGGAPVH